MSEYLYDALLRICKFNVESSKTTDDKVLVDIIVNASNRYKCLPESVDILTYDESKENTDFLTYMTCMSNMLQYIDKNVDKYNVDVAYNTLFKKHTTANTINGINQVNRVYCVYNTKTNSCEKFMICNSKCNSIEENNKPCTMTQVLLLQHFENYVKMLNLLYTNKVWDMDKIKFNKQNVYSTVSIIMDNMTKHNYAGIEYVKLVSHTFSNTTYNQYADMSNKLLLTCTDEAYMNNVYNSFAKPNDTLEEYITNHVLLLLTYCARYENYRHAFAIMCINKFVSILPYEVFDSYYTKNSQKPIVVTPKPCLTMSDITNIVEVNTKELVEVGVNTDKNIDDNNAKVDANTDKNIADNNTTDLYTTIITNVKNTVNTNKSLSKQQKRAMTKQVNTTSNVLMPLVKQMSDDLYSDLVKGVEETFKNKFDAINEKFEKIPKMCSNIVSTIGNKLETRMNTMDNTITTLKSDLENQINTKVTALTDDYISFKLDMCNRMMEFENSTNKYSRFVSA